ncbi:phasin family protein [Prosthecomicrobium sp. N25]|uniref:phasin family protein n=1 Tax=Prosthecomicrobium sp. N25 TaxID=3129254 RepID=UPI003076E39F
MLEEMQKATKENMDNAMKSIGVVSKGVQAIAVEVADYSKKSFEQSSATVEKLFGAKTLDKAIEVQSDFVKSAYEGYVAQMTKVGEMYVDLAKEVYKPYEGVFGKFAK